MVPSALPRTDYALGVGAYRLGGLRGQPLFGLVRDAVGALRAPVRLVGTVG
jgi:hypothetical protein